MVLPISNSDPSERREFSQLGCTAAASGALSCLSHDPPLSENIDHDDGVRDRYRNSPSLLDMPVRTLHLALHLRRSSCARADISPECKAELLSREPHD